MNAPIWPSVGTVHTAELRDETTGAVSVVSLTPRPIEAIPVGAEMVDRRTDLVVRAAGQSDAIGCYLIDFGGGDLACSWAGELFDVIDGPAGGTR
jgi:hypothetical protein